MPGPQGEYYAEFLPCEALSIVLTLTVPRGLLHSCMLRTAVSEIDLEVHQAHLRVGESAITLLTVRTGHCCFDMLDVGILVVKLPKQETDVRLLFRPWGLGEEIEKTIPCLGSRLLSLPRRSLQVTTNGLESSAVHVSMFGLGAVRFGCELESDFSPLSKVSRTR